MKCSIKHVIKMAKLPKPYKRILDFTLLLLSAITILYLTYLFVLLLLSPNYKLLIWESEPLILISEIILSLFAGFFCIIKALQKIFTSSD
ncbi:MAG: hypothetical protein AOA66_1603 [Candidatus Bathyarchaeota archaeon BA2]|nr:MAG: hypothetical protein AOA66_1603 [Candidatus Bathyarchaeota archaeon BA2]